MSLDLRTRTAPATPNQAQLYFLQELLPGNPFYNVALSVRMRGRLDADRLCAALEVLVGRHDALRTGFHTDAEGRVIQQVVTAPAWSVRRADITDDDARAALSRRLAREPFDMTVPPLIRCSLLRQGPEDHTLLMVFHHIVIDAWSVGILWRELSELYNTGAELQETLSPLDIRTPDSAERLAEEWAAILTADVATSPGAEAGFVGGEGALRLFRVPPSLTTAVRETAIGHRCSAFVVLLSALRLQLGRRGGTSDLTIGCPVAGRTDMRLEQVVGFFANTLPVRTRIDSTARPHEVIATVRNALLDALDRQAAPLARIVSKVSPHRDLRANPLFQVTCQQQNAADERLLLDGVECAFAHVDKGSTQFTLSLDIVDEGTEFALSLEYATEAFDGPAPADFEHEYLAVLAELCEVTPGPAAEPDSADRIADALRRALSEEPGRPALSAGDRTWSRAELLETVTAKAAELSAAGLRSGDRIAVAAPRSAEAAVLMLAAFLSRATYCPLDERMTAAQIEAVLEILRPRLIVDGDGIRLLAGEPAPATGSASVSYIVHTSGSAGGAKQAAVPARAFAAYLDVIGEQYALGPDDRALHFAATGFDVGVEEVVVTLLHGGTVVIAPPGLGGQPERFLDFLREERVTVINLPSSFWHRIVEASQPDTGPLSLRLAVLGSEPLSPASLRRWRDLGYPGVRILHAYGVSECTVTVALHDLTDYPVSEETERFPIGRALPHAELLVVDEQGREVPPETTGRLVIGGQAAPGTGRDVFRTGDAARRTPEGDLELLGRIDRRFKRRGVLVDPEDIEQALLRHPGIEDVLVLVGDRGELAAALEIPAVAGDETDGAERVQDWTAIHDDESFNARDPHADPYLNTGGWLSAIHRTELSDRVMRSWADDAVAGISRFGPDRVLEIGCGTGMLLLRLAGECTRYVGIDVSPSALDYVAGTIGDLRPDLAHVELRLAAAHDLAGLGLGGPFDAVVIHSVAQYFPSADYLERLLDTLRPMLAETAVVHLGDIRSLPVRKSLYREQVLAADPSADVVAAVEDMTNREEELLLTPAWFHQRPGIAFAETFARRPWPDSELARYRFDARLFYGEWERGAHPVVSAPDPESLAATLSAGHDVVVIPDRRHPRLGKCVDDLVGVYTDAGFGAVAGVASRSPADDTDQQWRDWFSLAARYGYRVLLPFGSNGTGVDVTFVRAGMSFGDKVFGRALPADRGAGFNDPRRRDKLAGLLTDAIGALSATATPESIPTAVLVLERFPRAADGQLARSALASLARRAAVPSAGAHSPGSAAEQADPVVGAWCSVLGAPAAHDGDNFFASGGDSILALRLVSRLRSLGFAVGPAVIFRNQTLGELRNALGPLSSPVSAEAASDTDDTTSPDVSTGIGGTPLVRWFTEQRFAQPDHYHQSVLLAFPPTTESEVFSKALEAVLRRHHGSVHIVPAGDDTFAAAVHQARRTVRITPEPRVTAVVTACQAALIAHHVHVDAVSWNVLLEDLDAHLAGREPAGPAPGSAAAWTAALTAAVRGDPSEREVWRAVVADPPPRMFGDAQSGRLSWTTLNIPPVTGTPGDGEALLLAALSRTLAGLRPGHEILDREIHGRDALDDGAPDIIGWLAATHPLRLRHDVTPEQVRGHLDSLPHRGGRFLAHRFLAADQLAASPAEVCFTYLGSGITSGLTHIAVVPARESAAVLGPDVAAENTSAYALDVVASGDPWNEGVRILYAVDDARVSAADSASFGDRLAAEIRLLAADPAAPVMLAVTPLQAAMVLHTLARPDSLLGVEQTVFTFAGAFDPDGFAAAVQVELLRHDLLTSTFRLHAGEPRRQVHPDAVCPIHVESLKTLSSRDQLRRIDEFTRQDLGLGVDLSRAPAMRWAVFPRNDDLTTLVWTHHHAVLDGAGSWAFLEATLRRMAGIPVEEPVASFDAYVDGWKSEDHEEAVRHWRSRAADSSGPFLLFGDRALPSAIGRGLRTLRHRIDPGLAAGSGSHGTTVGTVSLAAWASVLMRLTGRSEVIIGATVLREPESPASVVGMHVATIPVFTPPAGAGQTVSAWLGRLREGFADDQFYAYLGESGIRRATGLRGRLYDTHFVYQNYRRPEARSGLRMVSASTTTRTGQPLTLIVDAAPDALTVELIHDSTAVTAYEASELLAAFLAELRRLADNPGSPAMAADAAAIRLAAQTERNPAIAPVPDAGSEGSTEVVVRRALAGLLGVADVHPDAAFFDIGARSALLAEARALLIDAVGRDFPLNHFFEHPTARRLAAALDAERKETDDHHA